MFRKLFGVLGLLVFAAVASAEPPSDQRIISNANLPPAGTGFLIIKSKLASGVVVPIPGLGFVPLPFDVWRCDVRQAPPANAPAGAPPVRVVMRLLTLAE